MSQVMSRAMIDETVTVKKTFCDILRRILSFVTEQNIMINLLSSKKLTGHIGFRLSVHPSVRSSKTVHARFLKFHTWIPRGKIADTHFFFVQVISLSGVMPL